MEAGDTESDKVDRSIIHVPRTYSLSYIQVSHVHMYNSICTMGKIEEIEEVKAVTIRHTRTIVLARRQGQRGNKHTRRASKIKGIQTLCEGRVARGGYKQTLLPKEEKRKC
jgi:hypothetical protein